MFRQWGWKSVVLVWVMLLTQQTAKAQAVFDEVNKDFGGAPRGMILSHQFKLTNKYNTDLHISSIRTSCGVCSSASFDKSTVKPGETALVTLQVDTNKFAGHKSFTVYLVLDRPVLEEKTLTASAISRDDLTIQPSVLSFGTVRMGVSPTASVMVEYRGQTQWQITSILNENGYLQPTLELVSRQSGLISYRLTVRLRDDVPAGSWHADIWLVTNDPTSPRLRVPLTVEIQNALVAIPKVLELGQLPKSDKVERRVTLRSGEPFKVLRVEGTDDQTIVTGISDEAKKVHLLKITIMPTNSAQPTELNKKLKFITNLPKDPVVEVELHGVKPT